MTLLIDNDVQDRIMDMSDAVEAIESAFRQLGEGNAVFRPRRVDVISPTAEKTHDENAFYQWAALRGAIREPPRFAYRFRSDVMYHDQYEGTVTRAKYNVEPGTYMGFVLLFDMTNGELLALLNDGILQHVRVGATAGVASKYLARDDAETVGMLGSGGMARTHASAFATVHDLSEIRVYSPTRAHREAYAEEVSEALGVAVTPVESGREAVRGAEIVAACTDAYQPVYEREWMEDGVFITNVTPNEITDETIDATDRVATTTNHAAFHPQVIGSDELRDHFLEVQGERDYVELNYDALPDILVGEKPPRRSKTETVHYENRSCGVQFPAVANMLYEKARERSLGVPLPLEWFQQHIRD